MQQHNAKFKMIQNIKAFTFTDDSIVDNLRASVRKKDKQSLQAMKQSGILHNSYEISNLVAYAGIQEIMKYLANLDVTTGLGINYGALGDGTANPSTASTGLDNEVFRKVKASSAYASNSVYIDFVYLKADTNGTYTEFGTFINSTDTPNDPFLFSYVDTGGWVKSNLESLFVSCEYTITNA